MNQTFRILGSPAWRIRDNREIACELAVKLHLSDGIPDPRMKEEERTGYDSKPVPDKIQTANVVEFMTQNVFELGAILLKANVRQKDRCPNPPERRRRRDPRKHQQS